MTSGESCILASICAMSLAIPLGQFSVEERAKFFKTGSMTRTAEDFANAVNVYGFSCRQTVEQLPTAVGLMAEVCHNNPHP